jgi:hypothetical protein
VKAADGAWLEALARFDSVVNPENGLDDDQVEHFRRRLLGSLDDLAEETGDHQDRAEAVHSALVAIDAGVYGICLHCHRPIGFSALSDEPATRICSACRACRPRPQALIG